MNEKTQKDHVIKHLEMVQGVVNRLGHNSFLIKGWSMVILAAGIIFIARSEIQPGWISLTFLIPIIGFWILDGYFISRERRFVEIYNVVRKQETTDFAMNPESHKDKLKCNWMATIFSRTLIVFYLIEILFVLGIFYVVINFVGVEQ